MTHDELMQLAFEAGAKPHPNPDCWGIFTISHDDIERFASLILSKLEYFSGRQPEQEPFEYWNAVEGWVKVDEVRQHFDSVGCGTIYKTAGEDRVPVYTTPPQRKPLNETTVFFLADKYLYEGGKNYGILEFARAIESRHGIES